MHTSDPRVLRARVSDIDYTDTLAALAAGRVAWVVVSGKMTAGKDTVAPALVDLMPTDPAMLRYGNLMRAELDPGLDVLRMRLRQGVADTKVAGEIAEVMSLPLRHALTLVCVLGPEMAATGGTLTAHSRTEGVRDILQHLGDDWRCLDDEDYWARQASQAALYELGQGRSVILTGGRFLPDVDLPRAASAFLLRLDVTRETQLARLTERDGIAPSADTLAALDHPGETALDQYPHFSARINNDGALGACLASATAAVAADLRSRSSVAA